MAELLDRETLGLRMDAVPAWSRHGKEIRRTFVFEGFREAVAFVNRVAEAAETVNHHPDIDIRWNRVSLVLSTHSKGGLTHLDFDLAETIDDLASGD
jgi:4a-hydroxytetrahydrobiopterin dehydratase